MQFTDESSARSFAEQPSNSLFARLRQRLASRPDSEHEMTPNRLAFATIVSGYLCIASYFGSQDAAIILAGTYEVFIGYLIVSLLIFAHILWRPEISVTRRLFAIVHDMAMISFAAEAAGAASGFFYPLYLWTVFGNGFRFGIPYLHAAMIASLIGFSAVLTIADFWTENFGLSIALMIGLILLPLYVSALIRKLSEAKRQAEEANKAKSLFLASVSHELRTPLNAIIGLSDLLNDQIADREQRGMTRIIAQSGRSLLRLINTVLDFSRAEAGQTAMHLSEFDLYTAAAEIQAMLRVQAKKKDVALSLHISATTPRAIYTDRRFIDDVLMNLTANAVKFTETGFVLINIDAIESANGQVRLRFEVMDTGIGIAPEAQSRIFELFTQADETIIDQYGGTGLGLTICKRLVELHGGMIGLNSEPEKGSTFWFEIDIAAGSSDYDATPANEQPVVVLSRNPALSGSLLEQLTAFSSQVLECDTLEAARKETARLRRQETAMPIVLVDRSFHDQHELLSTNRPEYRDLFKVPVILVQNNTDPLNDALRAQFVSALQVPADHAALAAIMAIGATISETSNAIPKAMPNIVRSDRSYSILIAEDNGTNQMVVAKILESAGHHSTIVGNGEEALTALREDTFDLVLMDVNMPIMNGIEATKLYRFMSLGNVERLPIIGLTADATPEAQIRCQEAGMDACALKPIEPQALLELIDSTVRAQTHLMRAEVTADETITPIAAHPGFTPLRSEPIDLTTLYSLEKLGGHTFVQELVSQFLVDAKVLLGELDAAVAEENVLSFRDIAHALRSSAANVGAMNVFDLCLGWRDITQQELAQDGDTNMHALKDAFDVAQTLLKAHTDSHGTATNTRSAAGK